MPLFHFELGRNTDGSPFTGDAKIRADTADLALARLRAILPNSIEWRSPIETQPGEVLTIYLDPSKVSVSHVDAEQSAPEVANDPLDTIAPGLGHFIARRAEKLVGTSVVCTSHGSDCELIAGKTLRVESVIFRPGQGSAFAETRLPLLQLRCPDGERHWLDPSEVFVTSQSGAAALAEVAFVFAESRRWAEGPFHLAECQGAAHDLNQAFFCRALKRRFPEEFSSLED